MNEDEAYVNKINKISSYGVYTRMYAQRKFIL
jgi:hypothetical protein